MNAPLRMLTLALTTAESNLNAIGEEPYPGYKEGDLAEHIKELKKGIAILQAADDCWHGKGVDENRHNLGEEATSKGTHTDLP